DRPRNLKANFIKKSYLINAVSNPSNGGTVSDGIASAAPVFNKSFSHGDSVTLHATPAPGYDFTGWTEAGTTLSNSLSYSFTATCDRNLVANFKIQTFSVKGNVAPAGSGTISDGIVPAAPSFDKSYAFGDIVTLNALPVTGYVFSGWSEDSVTVSTNPNFTFTVSKNRNLVAHFSSANCIVKGSVNPVTGGTISANGAAARTAINEVYDYGKNVTLSVSPANGFDFIGWTEDGITVSNSPEYSFTVTKDRTFVANLVKKQYTITAAAVTSDAGTVAVTGTGTGSSFFSAKYNYADNVLITATAAKGFEFINWTEAGKVISSNVDLSFNALSDRNLYANFRKSLYTITTNANPANGGVTKGGGMFEDQTGIKVSATPAVGYTFESWSDDGNTKFFSPDYSFTVSANRNLTANFKKLEQYFITTFVSPTDCGTITGAGGYYAGETATLIATPIKGYAFESWTEDGNVVSNDATYAFVVDKNRSLTANFVKKSFTLTASSNPLDAGIISGTGITIGNGTSTAKGFYSFGDTVTLTATTTNPEYTFICWSDDGNTVSTNSVYTFAISKDHNLLANYVRADQYYIATYVSPPAGGKAVGGGGYYYLNTWATLTTEPNEGYEFVNWTENGTPVLDSLGMPYGETYKFLVTKDRSLTANFKPISYTISATTSPVGSATVIGNSPFVFTPVTGSGSGKYNYNDWVKLSVNPYKGFDFINWTEAGAPLGTSTNYAFAALKDRSIQANLAKITLPVTATVNPTQGGIITDDLISTTSVFYKTYGYGDTVNLKAIPSEGYEFANWTDDSIPLNINTQTYSFVIENARYLKANFILKSYPIKATCIPTEGGTVTDGIASPAPSFNKTFNYGNTVVLTATPSKGYEFINWTEDSTSLNVTSNDYSFIVDSSREVKANFIKKNYLITASTLPSGGGTITDGIAGATPVFNKTYNYGDSVALHVIPVPGYDFQGWTQGGAIVSTNPAYIFTADSSMNLVANFTLKTFSVKGTVSPPGSGTILDNTVFASSFDKTF
ncbi:MAG: InlB B-repeat-containing protein, partial [Bacteroidota bacterium]|nr:InlB B-repeat-containing protein [Bacteroidota bacterium]